MAKGKAQRKTLNAKKPVTAKSKKRPPTKQAAKSSARPKTVSRRKAPNEIWGFSGSPHLWKILILLEEKRVPYDIHYLSTDREEHRTPEMLKMNPRGKFPFARIGKVMLYESLAISEFIERTLRGAPLIPTIPARMAFTLVRAHEAATFGAVAGDPFLYVSRTKPELQDQEYLRLLLTKAHKELAVWEEYLGKGSEFDRGKGPFLTGPKVTFADAMFFPHLAFCVRTGLRLDERFPRLAAYYKLMLQRKSVQRTWPPHWRESPGRNIGWNELVAA